MKLTFIGCGGAFSLKNLNSNMLIETEIPASIIDNSSGKDIVYQLSPEVDNWQTSRLLIDCGFTAHQALDDMGLSAKDIDSVYISHQHADHAGGLEWFGFTRYFLTPGQKPKMFINERLAENLWTDTLRGGMSSHQGVVLTLDSFFDVSRIGRNGFFHFGRDKYTPIQMIHIMNGYEIVPSYGLMIEIGGATVSHPQQSKYNKKVFITTDTTLSPHLMEFYKQADVIFQDCETYDTPSGVHAHYNDLVGLPPIIKEKMWLYHYADGKRPDAEADGFKGFVYKGQEFIF